MKNIKVFIANGHIKEQEHNLQNRNVIRKENESLC